MENVSVKSNEDQEIDDEDWDVINGENELELLKVHFEEGSVGASLCMDSNTDDLGSWELRKTIAVLSSELASAQISNATMTAKIIELEHELKYADKARIIAEQRNAHLCATNGALAEEAHSLTETLNTMKRDYEGVQSEKRNLKKNNDNLESFVEETISNSQSGYNFLCEARERITDITKELMGLRNFLYDETSAMYVDDCATGFKGGVLDAVMSDFNVTLSLYKEVFGDVSTRARQLKASAAQPISYSYEREPIKDKERSCSKIALSNFSEGDIAMFFPTPKGDYVAFNIGTPHHYLSEESKALIGHDPHFKKVYVLGRVIMKEEKVAKDTRTPFNLKAGTTYYEISLESIASMFPVPAMKGSNHNFREKDC